MHFFLLYFVINLVIFNLIQEERGDASSSEEEARAKNDKASDSDSESSEEESEEEAVCQYKALLSNMGNSLV